MRESRFELSKSPGANLHQVSVNSTRFYALKTLLPVFREVRLKFSCEILLVSQCSDARSNIGGLDTSMFKPCKRYTGIGKVSRVPFPPFSWGEYHVPRAYSSLKAQDSSSPFTTRYRGLVTSRIHSSRDGRDVQPDSPSASY